MTQSTSKSRIDELRYWLLSSGYKIKHTHPPFQNRRPSSRDIPTHSKALFGFNTGNTPEVPNSNSELARGQEWSRKKKRKEPVLRGEEAKLAITLRLKDILTRMEGRNLDVEEALEINQCLDGIVCVLDGEWNGNID